MVTLLNAFLIPLTIIGNVFLMAAMITTPSLRSPSTVFLCSLAVSDLLVGLVVQPIYIGYRLNSGPALQHAFNILSSLSSGASLCTMIAISVDRFLSLHYHLRYPNLMTEKRAICASTSIWFTVMMSCLSLWNLTYANLVYAPAITICIMISTVLYIRIYQIARRNQPLIHIQQQTMQTATVEHNINIARCKKSA